MSDLAESHDALRPLMFSVAYRMLGSVSEAEDVVQEAFLRLHQSWATDGPPDNPEAYATTVVTRLSIDTLRSARIRRERYVGTWLPEPLLEDDDPVHQVLRDDSVSSAFLVTLERLTPVERAVFLLREVLAYDYADIATVVDRSETNCRKIFSRALRRLEDDEARFVPDPDRHDQLTGQFLAALTSADTSELERWLADDVVFYADGGGRTPAIHAPLHGAVTVARFLRGLVRQGERFGVQFRPGSVGGYPAYRLLDEDGAVLAVLTLQTYRGTVTSLRNQINPDKLRHLGPVGDLAGMLGRQPS